MIPAKRLTRGDAARLAGVNPETLRYYERRGLLPQPSRSLANYRLYTPETVRRLHFVKNAKRLGFSLEEIKELLELRARPGTRARAVRQKIGVKLQEIDKKILSLEAMRSTLARLHEDCEGSGPTGKCPILEALDPEDPS